MDFARVTVSGSKCQVNGWMCDGGTAAGETYAFVQTTSHMSLETVRLLRRPALASTLPSFRSKTKADFFPKDFRLHLFSNPDKNECFENISTSIYFSILLWLSGVSL